MRDYIVCHYKMNSRDDTDYWRDNAANTQVSDFLSSLLSAWKHGEDLSLEVERQNIGQYYSVISWHCMPAGFGQFPSYDARLKDDPKSHRFPLTDVQEFNRRCSLSFSSHLMQLS